MKQLHSGAGVRLCLEMNRQAEFGLYRRRHLMTVDDSAKPLSGPTTGPDREASSAVTHPQAFLDRRLVSA